ncbi:MAG: VCBS repeat-containing protein [Nitrospiraceae bacterium]|nr:VCBS repeat-containing protein [Nitrospiraceae bacterium]
MKSLLRRLLVVLLLSVVPLSCAPKEEIMPPPPAPPALPERPVSMPEEKPAPPVRTKSVLSCEENTASVFNRCGLDVLPFVRPVFFDLDNDGMAEMIIGTKEGGLLLYRNTGSRERPSWKLVEGYFRGIRAGAFSSPAVGDIDGDGRIEVVVGTGGFSSDSGRVLFYRNTGTPAAPVWELMDAPEIRVGNDAMPALFRNSGRLDLIVGNSTGSLSYYRNKSTGKQVVFAQDRDFFRGIKLGMYAAPAAVSVRNRIIVIAGNDRGTLHIIERSADGKGVWKKGSLRLPVGTFASPTFVDGSDPDVKDLVVSDSNGQLYYFRNRAGNYHDWEEEKSFFSGRILSGPACAPAHGEMDGRPVMVLGNIYGELRLFEYLPSGEGLPWKERPGFFKGVKLSGFSRGLLTRWQGDYLLITGQQDGILRAFRNAAAAGRPAWVEVKGFFRNLPKFPHASPTVFDLDGDGRWELVVGDAEGRVRGFRYEQGKDGLPVWREMEESFRQVRVNRFATPALYRDEGKIYLLAGEQDGRILTFSAGVGPSKGIVFTRDDDLPGIRVQNHSSPSVIFSNGVMDLTVGDYDGNIKNFACFRTTVPAGEN